MQIVKFRHLKVIVAISVLVVGVYIGFSPLLPEFEFRIKQIYVKPHVISSDIEKESLISDLKLPSTTGDVQNTLVIPRIEVNSEIAEGPDDSALEKGVWHRPSTSNPISGGNMVLSGHRFRYLPPNNKTFYNLDKLEIGDDVVVVWESRFFIYKVVKVFEVAPEDVYIENPSAESVLTLYTCTPLWTANRRLVVIAKFEREVE